MGYPDGYYYGQGRIICDTSTFSVGDTIRVRSMTDSSKVWNQQVATVGTALVFTVPPYDYYKICTVQDIGGVATEIGGVYKTVDYGQTLFVNVLDKNTLIGMQGILNAHNELASYSIGDEITIKINDGSIRDWKMLVAGINIYNSHEVILVSKYLKNSSKWYAVSENGVFYSNTTNGVARQNCANFYDEIVDNGKQYIKQLQKTCRAAQLTTAWGSFNDYVWIPNIREVTGQSTFGTNNQSCQDSSVPKTQFPIFTTQANRIRSTEGGATQSWWTCDGWDTNDAYATNVGTTGALGYTNVANTSYILPCFRLTADS